MGEQHTQYDSIEDALRKINGQLQEASAGGFGRDSCLTCRKSLRLAKHTICVGCTMASWRMPLYIKVAGSRSG
jgi:hypothetical protein